MHISGVKGRQILKLVEHPDRAKPGHVLWGSTPDSTRLCDRLYGSTTEAKDDTYPCVHAGFDMPTKKMVCRFADEDSCDNMVLDSKGGINSIWQFKFGFNGFIEQAAGWHW